MTAEEDPARRQRLATLRLGFIAVVVLIGLTGGLAWHLANPDPEDVVRDQLIVTADYLGDVAGYAVAGSASAEEAQERFSRAGTSFHEGVRYWVLEGRVVAPGAAQWDVVLGGSAYPFIAFGRGPEEFHARFRLTGKVGVEGSARRTNSACPSAAAAAELGLGNSTEVHLPESD